MNLFTCSWAQWPVQARIHPLSAQALVGGANSQHRTWNRQFQALETKDVKWDHVMERDGKAT